MLEQGDAVVPIYEKRLKAGQGENKSSDETFGEQSTGRSFDMSYPISRKEVKQRRKATSPEKSTDPSTRSQRALFKKNHNGESASEQVRRSTGDFDRK